jgi:Flp pilus assembly protein TadG
MKFFMFPDSLSRGVMREIMDPGVIRLMRIKKTPRNTEKGVAALEMALILPILLVLVFGIIDIGRLIQARLIVTSVSREGGTLVSHLDITMTGADVITVLQNSSKPLDLVTQGRIYVTQVDAGKTAGSPDPVRTSQTGGGSLAVASRIDAALAGLPDTIYNRMRYDAASLSADVLCVKVIEVYYLYTPITPLPSFIEGLLDMGGGILIRGVSLVSAPTP